MRRWRSLAGGLAIAVSVAAAGAVFGQDGSASTILTIDQEQLFVGSEFGKAVLAREAAAAKELEAENARIEADLIAEEQDLTVRRETLLAEEFTALATAFDEKVVRIRAEQDAKARELTRAREGDRQAFFRAVIPVLGDLLVERKAVAILDKSSLILSLTVIDVTDEAIAKVNAALKPGEAPGDGSVPTAVPDPAPHLAPETAPETGPTDPPTP
jgi:Skp family chaperone for outer membrane proteins